MEKLNKAVQHNIEQIIQLLQQLNEGLYTQPITSLSNATIGAHVRHIIELYLELQKQTITAEILSTARKFAAFSYCLIGKNTLCRAEFQKLLDSNPAFALSPAEAGHPSWGSTFRSLTQKSRAPAAAPASPSVSATPSAAKPAAPK